MAKRNIRIWTCLVWAQMVFLDRVHSEETVVTKNCSCYTFHGSEALSWIESRQECKKTNGDLVSMETREEWEFIRDEIQTRTTVTEAKNEWHIGLAKINGAWIWASGTPLNWAVRDSNGCIPWQKGEPSGLPEKVGLMAKNHPVNTKGMFNDVRPDDLRRGCICEHVTDTCDRGVQRCIDMMIQGTTVGNHTSPTTAPLPTTTRTPKSRHRVTNPLSTQKSVGQAGERTIVPSQPNGSQRPEQKGGGEPPNPLIIIVSSAAVTGLIILSAVAAVLWRRKSRRRRRPSIRLTKKISTVQPRGQLTFVYDGDRVYATVDWGKKTKKKSRRPGTIVYTDLSTSECRDEVVRPAHAPSVPTIYTDIRSTWEPGTANQEDATNTLEPDSPTNDSSV